MGVDAGWVRCERPQGASSASGRQLEPHRERLHSGLQSLPLPDKPRLRLRVPCCPQYRPVRCDFGLGLDAIESTAENTLSA
jgi:hypothetical protein